MKAADVSLATFRGTRYEMLDIDIQPYGDMAVVFYIARYWVQSDDNGEKPITLRSVDIYRREGKGWNQCGSNICLVPDEGTDRCHENTNQRTHSGFMAYYREAVRIEWSLRGMLVYVVES